MTSPPTLKKTPPHAPSADTDSAAFDPARYRHHVKDMEISQEEADALLAALFEMMARFVELGWDVGAMPVEAFVLPGKDSSEKSPIALKNLWQAESGAIKKKSSPTPPPKKRRTRNSKTNGK